MRAAAGPAAGAGCLLSIAVVVAATWHADETALSPIEPNGAWGAAYVAAVVASFVLYVAGAWLVHRYGASLVAVVALAIVIQVAAVAAPLLYSTDAYTYWDYGRIAAVHDGNPYVDPPSDWPDDPAYTLMGAQWHNTTSAYGPLWTLTSEGVAVAAGESADLAAWLFKGIAALGSVALVLAVVAAAPPGGRAFAAAFVGWNPVLALQFAGGGHNDTLMMAFPLGGLALLLLGRRRLGAALWPIGIGIKWLPLIFLPLMAARWRRGFGWGGLVISGLVVAAVATAAYGVQWVRAVSPISNQLKRASSTSVPHYVEQWLDVPQYRVTQVLAVLFVLAYVLLLRSAWRGRTRLGLTAGLFCLSLAWLPAWYVAWPVSLAGVEDDRAARVLALGLTAWLLRDAIAVG
jgi:hypothetical protein